MLALLLFVMGMAIALATARVVPRIVPGHCAKCGYCLKGLRHGVCPECGTEASNRQLAPNFTASNKAAQVATVAVTLLSVIWTALYSGSQDDFESILFTGSCYLIGAAIPVVGCVVGCAAARRWDLLKKSTRCLEHVGVLALGYVVHFWVLQEGPYEGGKSLVNFGLEPLAVGAIGGLLFSIVIAMRLSGRFGWVMLLVGQSVLMMLTAWLVCALTPGLPE